MLRVQRNDAWGSERLTVDGEKRNKNETPKLRRTCGVTRLSDRIINLNVYMYIYICAYIFEKTNIAGKIDQFKIRNRLVWTCREKKLRQEEKR